MLGVDQVFNLQSFSLPSLSSNYCSTTNTNIIFLLYNSGIIIGINILGHALNNNFYEYALKQGHTLKCWLANITLA